MNERDRQPLSAQEKAMVDPYIEAYVYGYPLVTMELMRRLMTNVNESTNTGAPMGQFSHMRRFPEPGDRDINSPNVDTLYSLAWVDLSIEPHIFSVPDPGERLFMIPLLSGWTDVFAILGDKTTGAKAQTSMLVGPGWEGIEPQGDIAYIKSPTSIVWILSRVYCNGTDEDYKQAHAFQDGLALTPLSAYGSTFVPASGVRNPIIDMRTPAREQVNNLKLSEFFEVLAPLLKDNPPAEDDAKMVAKLEALGIAPGQPFNSASFPIPIIANEHSVPRMAQQRMIDAFVDVGGIERNGWAYFTNQGVYGTDYMLRALTALIALGASRPQDAVFPLSYVDQNGGPYDGLANYVLHFDAEQLPPVRGFWSLTLYDAQSRLVENSFNRYSLSSQSNLRFNDDGSLDIHIRHVRPEDETIDNWLPSPRGKFSLMLRLYWPTTKSPSIIDNTWQPPPVRRVS